jgi:N-acetylglucosaminyldiphosphoundecaprenol N-acetyl-beta-D-mannosaminyltransferase
MLKLPVLDVQVSPIALVDLLNWIQGELNASKRSLLIGHNLHSTYLYHVNTDFRSTYDRASMILCDGFPIAMLASREAGMPTSALRIGSTDWIPKLGQLSGISRIAVVGARQESNQAFCKFLDGTFAEKVEIESWSGENWNEEKALKVANEVSLFNPDVTLIGLGMPLQESFFSSSSKILPGLVALIGGAIDQLSGYQKNAPRFLGKLGLEWAWRLVTQPRRLFKRYLIEPWLLIAVLLRSKEKN